jgi:multicomponent Na+:H+ antiporter subunit C
VILVLSVVVSVLFACGVFLLLQRDLLRVVLGIVLISNAANLFIVSAGLSRGAAPIYPLPESGPVSDPLVQAMALTAIVISSSTAALLLALVYKIYASHGTIDLDDVSEAEMREAEALERGEGDPADGGDPEREEEPAHNPDEVELKEETR